MGEQAEGGGDDEMSAIKRMIQILGRKLKINILVLDRRVFIRIQMCFLSLL